MINIVKRNKHIEDKKIKALAKEHNTTTKIIELLLNRGYKEEDLKKYIQKDEFYVAPFNSMTNCDEAAETLKSYLNDI